MSRMVQAVADGKRSLRQALDEVAAVGRGAEPLLLEEATLYRILLLFAAVYARLLSFPVAGVRLPPALPGVRRQAAAVAALMAAQPRGSPPEPVLGFHRRYFPHLLFAVGPAGGKTGSDHEFSRRVKNLFDFGARKGALSRIFTPKKGLLRAQGL